MLIGELAKAAGVSKDTIRHYDSLGLLLSVKRQAGSRVYKEYLPENLERIAIVRLAKDLGFTLTQIASQFDDYYNGGLTSAQQIQIIQTRKYEVEEKIQELERVRTYLEMKIQLLGSGEADINPLTCLNLHEQMANRESPMGQTPSLTASETGSAEPPSKVMA